MQGNVYVVAGAGSQVSVLPGEDGVLIVDDQFDVMRDTLTAAIREISVLPIKVVINTHVHPDHSGGNAHF